MFDHRPTAPSGSRPDRYIGAAYGGAGLDAAWTLRLVALTGIASRLFSIFASANRISVADALLGQTGTSGQVLNYQGGVDLAWRTRQADSVVTLALWVSIVVVILFVLTLWSLGRRRKRGDMLAAALGDSRAIRFAGRLYMLAAIAAVTMRYAFTPNPDASPADQIHAVIQRDALSIGLQVAVIAVLLVVALAAGRAVRAPLVFPAADL